MVELILKYLEAALSRTRLPAAVRTFANTVLAAPQTAEFVRFVTQLPGAMDAFVAYVAGEADTPATPPPPPPTTRRVRPAGLRIEVAGVHGPDKQDFPFHMNGDTLMLDVKDEKGDPLTNLPIHSGVNLRAVYLDENGNPFRFEDRDALYLYHTAIWSAACRIGHVSIGPKIGATPARMETINARIANWREEGDGDSYEKTGGMDIVVHFPPEANDQWIVLRLGYKEHGYEIESPAVYLPKVS